MVRRNPSGNTAPTQPEGFMEYLAHLAQNDALLSVLQSASPPTTSTPTLQDVPPPPTQPRSFSRANRGTGGVLAEKQKVSKEITASATKRKSLVEPDVEIQVLPKPVGAVNTNARQAKRQKVAKVRESLQYPLPTSDKVET